MIALKGQFFKIKTNAFLKHFSKEREAEVVEGKNDLHLIVLCLCCICESKKVNMLLEYTNVYTWFMSIRMYMYITDFCQFCLLVCDRFICCKSCYVGI